MKTVQLSKELATEMYNGTNEQLKKLALETYPELNRKPAKERLLEMFEGCVIHFDDKYPESVFFMKNGEVWFEQDFKNSALWCRYSYVWYVFITEYNLKYEEIKDLIRGMVEERFKMSALTPVDVVATSVPLVEERFKMSALTPMNKQQ